MGSGGGGGGLRVAISEYETPIFYKFNTKLSPYVLDTLGSFTPPPIPACFLTNLNYVEIYFTGYLKNKIKDRNVVNKNKGSFPDSDL